MPNIRIYWWLAKKSQEERETRPKVPADIFLFSILFISIWFCSHRSATMKSRISHSHSHSHSHSPHNWAVHTCQMSQLGLWYVSSSIRSPLYKISPAQLTNQTYYARIPFPFQFQFTQVNRLLTHSTTTALYDIMSASSYVMCVLF